MQSASALIIHLTQLTETSLIVHWFTEEHGLVKTVAKGAKRPKSPFRGQLDLFVSGEISFIHSENRPLHVLQEVAISHWREGLRKSYTTTLLAAYCCQLIESAIEPEHPEPEIHDLLIRALDHLDTNDASLRALHHFEKELSRHLGIFHPQRPAHESLREMIGHLPFSRSGLIERLTIDS